MTEHVEFRDYQPQDVTKISFGSPGSFAERMDKPVRIGSAVILAILVLGILLDQRENVGDYLADVARRMKAQGVRVEVDHSDDRMQKKIRNAQLQKVPFMVLAGDQDVEAGAVSFRYRDGRQDNGVPVEEAIARVTQAVAAREQV